MSCGYQYTLGPKRHTRKFREVHKDFELYQVFMHNFLYQNVLLIPIIHIAHKKNEHILV